MLGQPVYFLTPDVVGFELTGQLREGVHRHRPGAHRHRDAAQATRWSASSSSSSAKARARWPCPTAPPSPTWRPSTARRWASSRSTSRPSTTSRAPAARKAEIEAFEAYFKAQKLFGVPAAGEIDYSQVVKLDLGTRGADRWPARSGRRTASSSADVQDEVRRAVQQAGRPTTASTSRPTKLAQAFTTSDGLELRNGDVLIAAITSLHQHQQPERAAGRRPAGEEGGRGRPEGAAAHQDLARAGLAHRHRVPREGRPAALPGEARLQRRRPTAAPPASATPAT